MFYLAEITLDGPATAALSWDALLSLAVVSLFTYAVTQGRKTEKLSEFVTKDLAGVSSKGKSVLSIVDNATDGISGEEIQATVNFLQKKAGEIIKRGTQGG